MFFRNLLVYRLPAGWNIDPAAFEDRLARQALQPCGGLTRESRGWIAPAGDDRLLYTHQRQWLLALGIEQKLLPAAVINQQADERAAAIEAEQGQRIGRKRLRELRQQVADELLPRAFVRRRRIHAWLDLAGGWLAVDAAAPAQGDAVMEQLGKTLEPAPAIRPLNTRRSPGAAMTGWLAGDEAPAGFSIDSELELRAADESRATVRYLRHPLEAAEIRAHIAAGKTATRLALTWNERIAFVLTDQGQVKRLAFLDILRDEAGQADSAEEQFELDFALMSGELIRLLGALAEALGGEQPPA